MGVVSRDAGHCHPLKNRIKQLLATATVVAGLAAGFWAGFGEPSIAGGETRTISLYHIHTKERLTVTYMQNGRYVPSAMKKIDWFMRDWRANKSVRMDPKTIDLIWELHADLGSKEPIHVVCGLRTRKTNSFLKRIGRGVAKKSQHVLGKAIDVYFPDVSTKKMRNSALVRKVGGVGYYPRTAGPTGFLHVDSGKVRHWGPRISQREMAAIFKQYKKTIGARFGKGFRKPDIQAPQPEVQVAKAERPPEIAYEGDGEDLAELTHAASQSPAATSEDSATLMLPAGEAKGAKTPKPVASFIPKPRQKPLEVLALAAAHMHIEPASAPPEAQIYSKKKKISPVSDSLGAVEAAETMIEPSGQEPVSDLSTKTSFAASIRNGTADDAPLLKPLTASLNEAGIEWGDLFGAEQAIRQDGKPQFSQEDVPVVPKPVELEVTSGQHSGPGKGDLLVVNRAGKGGLPASLSTVIQGRRNLGSLN
jgi:uncharacterized protein YcbK (DUF882 family)